MNTESVPRDDLQLASDVYRTNPGWAPHYARCKYQAYRVLTTLNESHEASLSYKEAIENMRAAPMYESDLTDMPLRVEVFDSLIPWLAK